MSRIGKQPIPIPDGVTVAVDADEVIIKGPKGELSRSIHPDISVVVKDNTVVCSVRRESKQSPALWGTTRAVIASCIKGVTDGFRKQLELHGVGFRAMAKGDSLELHVGYSHPVTITAPQGIRFSTDKECITVEGYDAELVGQVAADIRKVRKPEPYKGKGIRYAGEVVRRKVGKVVGGAEGTA